MGTTRSPPASEARTSDALRQRQAFGMQEATSFQQRLPPMVPALRTCRSPTVAAASPNAWRAPRRADVLASSR